MEPAAPAFRPPPRQPWHWRLRETVSAYLPLLLMGLLALATWWLVKNTPAIEAERPAAPPRHEPDYTMARFTLQRFDAAGQLRVQVEGEQLRHYPDTDTLEIDTVRIRSVAPGGAVTLATARRALANHDASEIQLMGGAQVVSEDAARGQPLQFEGEFLHAFLDTERLRSHLPVRLTVGANQIRAAGLEYDHKARLARFLGPMQGRFDAPARR